MLQQGDGVLSDHRRLQIDPSEQDLSISAVGLLDDGADEVAEQDVVLLAVGSSTPLRLKYLSDQSKTIING